MANHIQIAAATDLDIYFLRSVTRPAARHDENTNGLLRAYFRSSPTCPATTRTTRVRRWPNSTTGPVNDSMAQPSRRHSIDYSHNRTAIRPVLRWPVESTRPARWGNARAHGIARR